MRMWVLYRQHACYRRRAVLYPEKATVLGPCRVIPQELPHIQCRSIDIVLRKRGAGSGKACWAPAGRIRRCRNRLAVAYRDNARWCARL